MKGALFWTKRAKICVGKCASILGKLTFAPHPRDMQRLHRAFLFYSCCFFLLLIVNLAQGGQDPVPFLMTRQSANQLYSVNEGNFVDINGDGLVDYVVSEHGDDATDVVNKIWMNDGRGHWIEGSQWNAPSNIAYNLLPQKPILVGSWRRTTTCC